MSVILVIAAHPDDEILGVGATISKKISNGDEAFALILGEGQTSRRDKRENTPPEAIASLRENSISAGKIIGFTQIYFEDFPDNRFDSVDLLNIVKTVEKYLKLIKPNILYTHHAHDLNIDHRITSTAVLTATRPIGNYPVEEIYAFETVSSTEWNFGDKNKAFYPNVFIDIEEHFLKKCDAMKKYKSELCSFPHPRSLEMLEYNAKRWGGIVGKRYAEAFELLRKVE
ncbi:PIG-L family deacetylase [Lachnospiraceae bacterium 45-W7]